MKIPESVEEKQKYLNDVVDFAKSWSWIYTTRLTHILIEKVLEKNENFLDRVGCLPPEKLERVFQGEANDVDKCLSEFLKSCNDLTLEIPVSEHPCDVDQKQKHLERRLTPKKQHEVNRLGHFVSQIIRKHDLKTIIDIGSGLGYIDRAILTLCPGCNLIAVEADSKKCSKAAKLNVNHEKIIQICTRLYSGNVHDLSKQLLSIKNINQACLISLHACGDLTVNCFRLLDACNDIQHSVLVTCCYHKTTDGNFPLSNIYKDCNDLFPITFLRLASDRTRANFVNCSSSKFDEHVFNNLARAVIELFLHNNGLQIRKKKRKWVRKGKAMDWDLYIADWIDRHEVFASNTDSLWIDHDCLKKQLTELWLINITKFNCMKGLLILQIIFQSVAESFVLMDRLLHLYEKGYKSSELLRVTDPSISPRSVAYVVNR